MKYKIIEDLGKGIQKMVAEKEIARPENTENNKKDDENKKEEK